MVLVTVYLFQGRDCLIVPLTRLTYFVVILRPSFLVILVVMLGIPGIILS